jgi:large subunit ribosomal protein L23
MNAAAVNEQRLMQVLLAPRISEKGTMLGDKHNQYVFEVLPGATKPEIKAAVEFMFKVKVESVRVLNQKGKHKRFGRFMGRRGDTRKAYVSLQEGQEINFAGEIR